jgi:hypothetical protein
MMNGPGLVRIAPSDRQVQVTWVLRIYTGAVICVCMYVVIRTLDYVSDICVHLHRIPQACYVYTCACLGRHVQAVGMHLNEQAVYLVVGTRVCIPI